jgi:hypothetical protein
LPVIGKGEELIPGRCCAGGVPEQGGTENRRGRRAAFARQVCELREPPLPGVGVLPVSQAQPRPGGLPLHLDGFRRFLLEERTARPNPNRPWNPLLPDLRDPAVHGPPVVRDLFYATIVGKGEVSRLKALLAHVLPARTSEELPFCPEHVVVLVAAHAAEAQRVVRPAGLYFALHRERTGLRWLQGGV